MFQRVEGRETKMERERRWRDALQAADTAGKRAAETVDVAPMVVGTPRNMMASLAGGDDGGFRFDRPVYVVESGVCGFASVLFYAQRGGESRRFFNWLRGSTKSRVRPPVSAAYNEYEGAVELRVRDYGQSMTRKRAYASAFAREMQGVAEGLRVYSTSRMD